MKIVEQDNKAYILNDDGTYTVYQLANQIPIKENIENIEGLSKQTDSSFIQEICYLRVLGILTIVMNDTVYHYENVPLEIYERMTKANSYGEFYNTYIKGTYHTVYL